MVAAAQKAAGEVGLAGRLETGLADAAAAAEAVVQRTCRPVWGALAVVAELRARRVRVQFAEQAWAGR